MASKQRLAQALRCIRRYLIFSMIRVLNNYMTLSSCHNKRQEWQFSLINAYVSLIEVKYQPKVMLISKMLKRV